MTSICCQTNGSHCYLPMDFAYDQGGYEPRNTPIAKGVAEKITDATIDLLESL